MDDDDSMQYLAYQLELENQQYEETFLNQDSAQEKVNDSRSINSK